MGVRFCTDCRRAGVVSPAFHRVVSTVDGCAGGLVRMAVAPAALVPRPEVVAKAHIAESHGQYHSILAHRLGGAVSSFSGGGHTHGPDADCDIAPRALVTGA